jgi:hypothetical protein
MAWLRNVLVGAAVAALAVIGSQTAGARGVTATVAPSATHLSISVSRHWLVYGQSITVRTTLTDQATGLPIAGAQVSASWAETDVVLNVLRTTSASGTASVSFHPFANTSVAWDFAGSGSHAPSSSAGSAIHVRQAISIHAPAEYHGAVRGQTILVWGVVAPGYYGMVQVLPPPVHYVYLDWLDKAGWHRQAHVRLMDQKLPNGKPGFGYVARIVPGSRHLRAEVPSSGFNERGVSRTVYIPPPA